MKDTKVMNKYEGLWVVLLLLSVGLSFYYYPQMPERMATHWNFEGEANGFSSRLVGVFLFPLIMLIMTALFFAIPRVDPLKKNIDDFRVYYQRFVTFLLIFLMFVFLQTFLWNKGRGVSVSLAVSLGMGILLYYSGVLCLKAKRNWFIGIRTPWTLSSDKVWNKTHQLGGRLFQIAGLLAVVGVFMGQYAFYFVLVPVIGITIFIVFYSYFVYRKEKK